MDEKLRTCTRGRLICLLHFTTDALWFANGYIDDRTITFEAASKVVSSVIDLEAGLYAKLTDSGHSAWTAQKRRRGPCMVQAGAFHKSCADKTACTEDCYFHVLQDHLRCNGCIPSNISDQVVPSALWLKCDSNRCLASEDICLPQSPAIVSKAPKKSGKEVISM